MYSATATTKQEAGNDDAGHSPDAHLTPPRGEHEVLTLSADRLASRTGRWRLRTLLYADPGGDTRLAAGQPGLLFASYGDPRIAYVGHELDTLLARLIILLGGGLPVHLAAEYALENEDA